MKVVVGSRESKLAVIQSEMVIRAIKEYDDNIDVELVTMKTTGDIILDKTLDKIGGKGLFVKELDKALMDKRFTVSKICPWRFLKTYPFSLFQIGKTQGMLSFCQQEPLKSISASRSAALVSGENCSLKNFFRRPALNPFAVTYRRVLKN